jgi:prepilin-type N-terminal cleavage/methylation domain-containing protein
LLEKISFLIITHYPFSSLPIFHFSFFIFNYRPLPIFHFSFFICLMTRLPQSGFTLLELLVALTLSTLVMLVLAMGMNTVLKEWTRSSNVLDESLDKVLVLLQIERSLEGAFPHTYKDREENKNYIFFEGEEDQLAWVSTVSPGQQPGLTVWQLLPSDEETGVDIRVLPAFAGDPTERLEEHAKAVTALEGYKAYFEYLYVDEKIEEETEWLKEWSAKKLRGLPHAVRVLLESDSDEIAGESLEIIAVIRARRHKTIRFTKPQ